MSDVNLEPKAWGVSKAVLRSIEIGYIEKKLANPDVPPDKKEKLRRHKQHLEQLNAQASATVW